MRAVLVVAIIAALTASAHSQGMRGKGRHAPAQKSEESKKKTSEKENAYRAAIESVPDGKYDPWQTVRGAEVSKGKKNSH
jgi:hypothetical protein